MILRYQHKTDFTIYYTNGFWQGFLERVLAVITEHFTPAGISVNAVSAFYHDHIFIPSDKADIAFKLLFRSMEYISKIA